MIYKLLRFVLFRFDAETIHNRVMSLLSFGPFRSILSTLYRYEDKKLERTVFGLTFKNPVGLAAGFDKNGTALLGLQALGFGFIEVGTVTPKPQPGNTKPRIFRFEKQQAIVNWLGFNNDGVQVVVDRIRKVKPKMTIPVGLNLGKGRETPLENASNDYLYSMEIAYPYVDFFTVNISSPNTPQLRELQDGDHFLHLLSRLKIRSYELAKNLDVSERPIVVKLAPELDDQALTQIIMACKKQKIAGIIATNTTIDYSLLPEHGVEKGGISGKPLFEKSTHFIRRLRRLGALDLAIIGVGGIFSAEDARAKLDAGAALVEVYTGLIYEGPGIVKKIKQKL